jgi:hypothetical protein
MLRYIIFIQLYCRLRNRYQPIQILNPIHIEQNRQFVNDNLVFFLDKHISPLELMMKFDDLQ